MMNNLKDKKYRHLLIERYLDADTSIEEEKALADFYRHSSVDTLTDEDINIRNLMLGIGIAAKKSIAPKSYKWVRYSALILAAAMLAGLIFLVFPHKHTEKTNFAALTPASVVIRSPQSTSTDSNMGTDAESMTPLEQMEKIDSAFLADTQNIGSQKVAHKKASKNAPKKNIVRHAAASKQVTPATETEESAIGNEYYQIYEVASAALPSTDQLKIDNQGDQLVITTTDKDGNSQHYTISLDQAEEGLYQLHPLAQLE